MSLQQKVLMQGGRFFCFHTLLSMAMASVEMLPVPCVGSCTWNSELKSLNASLEVQVPFFAGFHLMASVSFDGII